MNRIIKKEEAPFQEQDDRVLHEEDQPTGAQPELPSIKARQRRQKVPTVRRRRKGKRRSGKKGRRTFKKVKSRKGTKKEARVFREKQPKLHLRQNDDVVVFDEEPNETKMSDPPKNPARRSAQRPQRRDNFDMMGGIMQGMDRLAGVQPNREPERRVEEPKEEEEEQKVEEQPRPTGTLVWEGHRSMLPPPPPAPNLSGQQERSRNRVARSSSPGSRLTDARLRNSGSSSQQPGPSHQSYAGHPGSSGHHNPGQHGPPVHQHPDERSQMPPPHHYPAGWPGQHPPPMSSVQSSNYHHQYPNGFYFNQHGMPMAAPPINVAGPGYDGTQYGGYPPPHPHYGVHPPPGYPHYYYPQGAYAPIPMENHAHSSSTHHSSRPLNCFVPPPPPKYDPAINDAIYRMPVEMLEEIEPFAKEWYPKGLPTKKRPQAKTPPDFRANYDDEERASKGLGPSEFVPIPNRYNVLLYKSKDDRWVWWHEPWLQNNPFRLCVMENWMRDLEDEPKGKGWLYSPPRPPRDLNKASGSVEPTSSTLASTSASSSESPEGGKKVTPEASTHRAPPNSPPFDSSIPQNFSNTVKTEQDKKELEKEKKERERKEKERKDKEEREQKEKERQDQKEKERNERELMRERRTAYWSIQAQQKKRPDVDPFGAEIISSGPGNRNTTWSTVDYGKYGDLIRRKCCRHFLFFIEKELVHDVNRKVATAGKTFRYTTHEFISYLLYGYYFYARQVGKKVPEPFEIPMTSKSTTPEVKWVAGWIEGPDGIVAPPEVLEPELFLVDPEDDKILRQRMDDRKRKLEDKGVESRAAKKDKKEAEKSVVKMEEPTDPTPADPKPAEPASNEPVSNEPVSNEQVSKEPSSALPKKKRTLEVKKEEEEILDNTLGSELKMVLEKDQRKKSSAEESGSNSEPLKKKIKEKVPDESKEDKKMPAAYSKPNLTPGNTTSSSESSSSSGESSSGESSDESDASEQKVVPKQKQAQKEKKPDQNETKKQQEVKKEPESGPEERRRNRRQRRRSRRTDRNRSRSGRQASTSPVIRRRARSVQSRDRGNFPAPKVSCFQSIGQFGQNPLDEGGYVARTLEIQMHIARKEEARREAALRQEQSPQRGSRDNFHRNREGSHRGNNRARSVTPPRRASPSLRRASPSRPSPDHRGPQARIAPPREQNQRARGGNGVHYRGNRGGRFNQGSQAESHSRERHRSRKGVRNRPLNERIAWNIVDN